MPRWASQQASQQVLVASRAGAACSHSSPSEGEGEEACALPGWGASGAREGTWETPKGARTSSAAQEGSDGSRSTPRTLPLESTTVWEPKGVAASQTPRERRAPEWRAEAAPSPLPTRRTASRPPGSAKRRWVTR